jgi:hypothetical protein
MANYRHHVSALTAELDGRTEDCREALDRLTPGELQNLYWAGLALARRALTRKYVKTGRL